MLHGTAAGARRIMARDSALIEPWVCRPEPGSATAEMGLVY